MAELRVAELAKLRRIALAAIDYVNEIDAPNPHEPYSIANRRDELRDVVHAHQGRPQRGERREPAAVRRVVDGALAVVRDAEERLLTQPLPPKKEGRMLPKTREALMRDIEVKRRELHDAAAKYGAEANKRSRNAARVAELGVALDMAAEAFSITRANLRIGEMREQREAAS